MCECVLTWHCCFVIITSAFVSHTTTWAGRTKKKKVYLLSTQHRPVPLQHYLFYDDDMYPLLVENKFNENAISDATKRSKEKAAV